MEIQKGFLSNNLNFDLILHEINSKRKFIILQSEAPDLFDEPTE